MQEMLEMNCLYRNIRRIHGYINVGMSFTDNLRAWSYLVRVLQYFT